MQPVRRKLEAIVRAAALLCALAWSGAAAGHEAPSLREVVARMGGHPCRTGAFTCVDLQVPIDHFQPGKRMTVEFAVHFAARQSKGILVYVVGGPGASGISVADVILGTFDRRLADEMDIVFFDQRGTGPLSGLACDKAEPVYARATLSLDRPGAAMRAAQEFVAACVAEMGHADLLPYLDTEQAIRDLEAFRRRLGAPRIWVYGQSYGTQFAQQYAARYPGALDGLIIDGVVDLDLDADGYYTEAVRTVERMLQQTFEACEDVPSCRADMAEPAATVFDTLERRLAEGEIDVDFPLADGRTAKRRLTGGMLDATAIAALYNPDTRARLLRVLAAVSRGDLLPMLRLAYKNLAVDPETLAPAANPRRFGAAFFAITCPDYDDAGAPNPVAQAQRILQRARALQAESPRLIRFYFDERLPCAFWPAAGRRDRPRPFTGGRFPTLVLNSSSDPATPVSNGYAVFDRLKNAAMVTMDGGPHVIWGNGLACPDRIVLGLLLDHRRPLAAELACQQDFLGTYAALTLTDAEDAADPINLAAALEVEVLQSPQLYYWDGASTLTVGCDRGGSVTISPGEPGIHYRFKACSWWPGLWLTGTGRLVAAGDGKLPDGWTFDLDVGGRHQGSLHFHHDSTTAAFGLDGTYDGRPARPRRPAF